MLSLCYTSLMRDFNRDHRSGGGGRDFKRRDFDQPQIMHHAVCSNCGKDCEVPFKPSGSKPVFCRECFQNNRTSQPQRSDNFQRRDNFEDRGNRPSEQPASYNGQFDNLNAKLDKILSLLAANDTSKKAVKNVVMEEKITQSLEVPQTQEPSEIALPPIVKKKKVSKK
jgi:CxxC-x17-CxxC domain-containing protein